MDGINGITATTLGLWGAVTLLEGRNAGIDSLVLIGALTAGACLGFLPWNAPAARLFLGDVGSYLLGGTRGGRLVLAWHGGARITVVAAPLVPYAADVIATLVRRALRRESLTEPHREHFYQVLTGPWPIGHAVVACLYGVVAFACGAVALVAPTAVALTVFAVVALAVAVGPHFLDRMPVVSEDAA